MIDPDSSSDAPPERSKILAGIVSSDAPPERSNVIAGIVVVLLFASILTLWLFRAEVLDAPKYALFTVHYDGAADVDTKTEVTFRRSHIGKVVLVQRPRAGVQLTFAVDSVPPVRQVVTLFPGDSAWIQGSDGGHGLSSTLVSLRGARVASKQGVLTLHRIGDGRWIASGSIPGLTVNGRVVGSQGETLIRSGDVFKVHGMQLQWQDPAEYTGVVVGLDTAHLRKELDVSEEQQMAGVLGPGSTLALATNFGLSRPTIRLEPSFANRSIFGQPANEIAPAERLDLRVALERLASYLASPSKRAEPPSTRAEQAVSDLNSSLASLAQSTQDLQLVLARARRVSGRDAGAGMIGRLILTPKGLDSLEHTLSDVAALAAVLSDTSRPVVARLGLGTFASNLDTVSASLATHVDSILGSTQQILASGDTALKRMGRALVKGDSIALQIKHTGKSVSGTTPWMKGAAGAAVLAAIIGSLGLLGAW
jgi:hypothetical protein